MSKELDCKFSLKCQISNSSKTEGVINLGNLPPVNDFVPIGKILKKQETYPANLLYFPKSGLAQLSIVINKKILFPKEYPYTSSTTKVLRENFQDLFLEIKNRFNFNKNDLVIDIGSNDGNLLQNFKNNYKVLGITPEDIGRVAIKNGIPTILDYFNKKTVKKILKNYGTAKIITATNVFAHIDNVNTVLKLIKKILHKDGIFVSESHYFYSLLEDIQYDTIYHEHLRYYSLTSLYYLFKKFNLEIINVKKIKTHGGSIRVYAAYKGKYKVENIVKKILIQEKKNINLKKFLLFKKKVILSKTGLIKIIYDIINKKKNKIAGIGAPSRAATLINYVGLDHELITCVFEIKGSSKIGKYMPGTIIPVYEEKIKNLKKFEYLIIFSWHIYKEIIKNLKKKGYKGKFIIPLPYPRIIN
jgi:hypothetical protein